MTGPVTSMADHVTKILDVTDCIIQTTHVLVCATDHICIIPVKAIWSRCITGNQSEFFGAKALIPPSTRASRSLHCQ